MILLFPRTFLLFLHAFDLQQLRQQQNDKIIVFIYQLSSIYQLISIQTFNLSQLKITDSKLIEQIKKQFQITNMQFKQKLVTDRRQNEYKVYSSFTTKNYQSKPSISQRLQQEYQINKENQSTNPIRFRSFESTKVQNYDKQRYPNYKNQYGFANSTNHSNNRKPHDWIQRNRGASNRILIQENEYSEHPSMQQALEYQNETSRTNSQNHTFGKNSNSKVVYNKFAGGNIYQQEQRLQNDEDTVYIDKAFLTKSIEAEDMHRSNSQAGINSNQNFIFADKIRNGYSINATQIQTDKKSKLSQRNHVRHESVNLDQESGRPLTFGLVQNCSMVKSQKWQPSKQEEQSQQVNYFQNRRQEANHPNQQLSNRNINISMKHAQQKSRREQMLDQILMKQSAEKVNNTQRGLILRTQPNFQLTKSQEYLPSNNYSLLRSQQHGMTSSVQRPFLMQSMAQGHRNQRSSRGMLNSVNINPVFPCNNHPNKRAKYMLIGSEQQMNYCSKCAVNLLQQGFKVQQLKKDLRITVQHPIGNSVQQTATNRYQAQHNMSIVRITKREKQLENFENKINQTEGKIQSMLQKIEEKAELNQIQENMQALKRLFDNFSQHLQKIKQKQTGQMQQALNKEKYYMNQSKNELITRLGSLQQIKSELNEYRGKFMSMDENEYHFLLESFINKVQSYQQNPRKQSTAMKKHGMKRSQIKTTSNQTQLNKNFNVQSQIYKIVNQLYHRLIDKSGAEISFDKKEQQQSFDYYCQQAKQPFRSLFHDEEQENSQKVQSTRNQSKVFEPSRPQLLSHKDRLVFQATDSPTFKKYGC